MDVEGSGSGTSATCVLDSELDGVLSSSLGFGVGVCSEVVCDVSGLGFFSVRYLYST